MKWLFLVHQIKTSNSRERVKIWRLTKKVGAILHRNSVYVLPYSKERLEDFHWLCQQIKDSQGDASVFVCESTTKIEDKALRELFESTRNGEYSKLLESVSKLAHRIKGRKEEGPLSEESLKSFSKELIDMETAFSDIERIDFFNTPQRGKVKTMIGRAKKELDSLTPTIGGKASAGRHLRKQFIGKTWATREHIHIDRLCSAWLIKRFIDPKAEFIFASEKNLPTTAISFDTFGGEFSHHGEDCTFETLLRSFRIKDKALTVIGQIVHDVDMKDGRFGRPEAAGLNAVVRSLSDSLKNDHKVLEVGSIILDGLYDGLIGKRKGR